MGYTQWSDSLELGQWVPQADFEAEQTDKGGWRGTQSFMIVRGTIDTPEFTAAFSEGALATTLDPKLPVFWGFMSLSHIVKVANRRGGYSSVTAAFAGFGSMDGNDEALPDPTYHLRGQLSERSIMEHEKVVALAIGERLILEMLWQEIYRWDGANSKVQTRVVDEFGFETWRDGDTQLVSADSISAADLIAAGKKTYQHPSFVWEKRWESDEAIPNEEFNNLGHIDVPDGTPPEPAGDRDWMLTYGAQDEQGGLFSAVKEWTLSERGGFDTFLYSD